MPPTDRRSAQDDPSTFNLVGFGFILYIHAHARQFAPNAHVYLIVISRIVELLGMNVLLCRRPPLVSRLVFTMVLSAVMTVHYVYTAVQSDEYPIIHSGGRLMEVSILGMIVLTIALHLLTMYFVDRRVDLHRLFFHRSSLPHSTDDFSLAVLKLGTACLHATKLTGFSCELQALDTPLRTYVELRPDGSTVIENSIEDLEQMDSHTYHPLEHEIKDLRVVLEHSGVEMGGVVRGADKMRALTRFFQTLLEIVWTIVREGATYTARYLPAPPAWVHHIPRYVRLFWHGTNGEAERDARLAREAAQRAEAEKAHTRMEELRARRAERALHSDDASDEDEADLDATQLVALAQQDQGADAATFQDMLVKHMLRADAAPPLTRRAYARLAAPAAPLVVSGRARFTMDAPLGETLHLKVLRSPHARRFVVHVSAMEGQFSRESKTVYHPHTNMAKAALNMLTRTSAADYAQDGIYMNSVDTGWVTDENPAEKRDRIIERSGFTPPLDNIDGMARIYDPIAQGVGSAETPLYGHFLKDFRPFPW